MSESGQTTKSVFKSFKEENCTYQIQKFVLIPRHCWNLVLHTKLSTPDLQNKIDGTHSKQH